MPEVHVAEGVDWVTKLGVRFERGIDGPPDPEFPPGAWDVANAAFDGSYSQPSPTGSRGLDFHPDGTRLYVTNRGDEIIIQQDLSTPWDLSTLSAAGTLDVSGELGSGSQESSAAHGVVLSGDGSLLYVWNRTEVWVYALSTPYDITTGSVDGYADLDAFVGRGHDHRWRPDGTRYYVCDRSGDGALHQFDASTPWDVDTLSYEGDTVPPQHSEFRGCHVHPLGVKAWIFDTDLKLLQQADLATAWDVTSATWNDSVSTPEPSLTAGGGFRWKPDGSAFYVVSGGSIFQYDVED